VVTTGVFGTGRLEALNAGGAAQPANFGDPAAISTIGVAGPLAGPVNVLTGQSAGGTDLGAVAADYLAGVYTFTGVDEATDCASGDGNACKGYVVVDYNGVLVSSIRWSYWGNATADPATVSPTAGTVSQYLGGFSFDVPPPEPASLGDVVWEDLNADGVQDVGEPGVGGVVVTLTDCAGGDLQSTTTASDGTYSFTNLAAGSYCVRFVPPATCGLTGMAVGGDPARDSNADPATGLTAPVALAAGEANLTIDAGCTTVAAPTPPASPGDPGGDIIPVTGAFSDLSFLTSMMLILAGVSILVSQQLSDSLRRQYRQQSTSS